MGRKNKERNSLKFTQIQKDKKTNIELNLTKINLLYDPKIILSIVTFFSFTSIDSKMKNEALDRL